MLVINAVQEAIMTGCLLFLMTRRRQRLSHCMLSRSSIVVLACNILEDIFEEIETMINDCGDDGDCYKGCTKKVSPFQKLKLARFS